MNSLALYIHIPYCLEKCPYCDFHSIAVEKREIPDLDYAQLLILQLKEEVERLGLKNRPLVSIFFGGGTPSLMSKEFFEKILAAIEGTSPSWGASPHPIEITVETNPATATKTDFQEWLKLGINRISFGVQSFQEKFLRKLGRSHSSHEAVAAVQKAKEAGFINASLDLIFGIEGQTPDDLKKDLAMAISMGLPHISAYQLTVESGTPLDSWVKQKKFHLPPEEILISMHRLVTQTLEEAGLKRYEISNYAKPGHESNHNLQYWRYGDYLGIGSGAVSYVKNKRWRTTRKLKEYLKGNWGYEDEEKIDWKTALKEKWMMGIRLTEGMLLDDASRLWIPQFLNWEKEGILNLDANRVKLTEKGFLLANWVTQNVFALIDQMC